MRSLYLQGILNETLERCCLTSEWYLKLRDVGARWQNRDVGARWHKTGRDFCRQKKWFSIKWRRLLESRVCVYCVNEMPLCCSIIDWYLKCKLRFGFTRLWHFRPSWSRSRFTNVPFSFSAELFVSVDWFVILPPFFTAQNIMTSHSSDCALHQTVLDTELTIRCLQPQVLSTMYVLALSV